MAVDLKPYDFPQVLRSVFEVDDNCLRVKVVNSSSGGGGELEIVINHTEDSVRLGDGTDFLTSSVVGSKRALDVNLVNTLDVSGSVVALDAATLAALEDINVTVTSIGEVEIKNDSGNPVPVNGTVSVTGVATEAKQDTQITALGNLLTELQQKTEPTDTQPISAASLPLPAGASTSANQVTANASLSSIDGKLTSPLTVQATDLDVRDLVFATDKVDASGSSVSVSNFPAVQPINDNGGSITVDGVVSLSGTSNVNVTNPSIAVTGPLTDVELRASAVPISAASLPLPSGAATSANQVTANNSLSSIDTKLTSPLTVQATNLDIRDLVFATDKVDVTGSSVSISGTPTVELGATSLAALEDINVTVTSIGEVEIKNDSGNPVPVNGTVTANLGTIAGVATEATLSSLNSKVTAVDTGAVVVSSSALPTGAATSALQTSGNVSLGNIDTKTPSLGQATMVASTPVAIASNQTALPVTGTFFQATQPVSLASQPLPTGASTSALQTTGNTSLGTIVTNTGNINTKLPNGLTVKAASTPAVAADQALVVTLSPNNPVTATISNASIEIANDVGNPIPVNGTVTANAGTGTFQTNITNPSIAVTGPLTDVELRASAVPISAASLPLPTGAASESTLSTLNSKVPSNLTVSSTRLLVDNSGVTQPISASTLPLPSGASTSANQVTSNSSLSSIDGKTAALGQTNMAGSSPVVIASNQSAIPVTGTFFQATQPISGSVSVSNFPATQPVSAASLPLPTGAATEATLSAVNTKLSNINLTVNSPQFASMTSASSVIIAANASRTGLVITNESNNRILYLAFGASAVVGSGIVLYPKGSFYMDKYSFSTAAIQGILDTGTANVSIQEFQ